MTEGARFGKVAVLMGGPSSEREISSRVVLRYSSLREAQVDAGPSNVSSDVFEPCGAGKYDRGVHRMHGPWRGRLHTGGLDVIGMPLPAAAGDGHPVSA